MYRASQAISFNSVRIDGRKADGEIPESIQIYSIRDKISDLKIENSFMKQIDPFLMLVRHILKAECTFTCFFMWLDTELFCPYQNGTLFTKR